LTELYRVTLPYACCGFLLEDGRVVEAAPIIGWMKGRTLATVELWIHKKGGKLELIPMRSVAMQDPAEPGIA